MQCRHHTACQSSPSTYSVILQELFLALLTLHRGKRQQCDLYCIVSSILYSMHDSTMCIYTYVRVMHVIASHRMLAS